MQQKLCALCNNEFIRTYEAKTEWENRLYCSRVCSNRVTANKRYKGGWIDKDGYKIISIKGIKTREHRLVMEKYLGRKLLISEAVHHLNHVRNDNRIENLVLCTNFQEHYNIYHSNRKFFTCTIKDCTTVHTAKGLCKKHYYQQRYLVAYKTGAYKKHL